MKNASQSSPSYFSRLLGAVPAGVSPLRAPRGIPAVAPLESSPYSAPRAIEPAPAAAFVDRRTQEPEVREERIARAVVKDGPPEPLSSEARPARASEAPPPTNPPAADIAAETFAGEFGLSPRVSESVASSTKQPNTFESQSPLKPAPTTFLERVFERTSQRYRDEATPQPSSSQPIASPQITAPETVRTIQIPSPPSPVHAEPAIEIGHVEIRLQPPAPQVRSAPPRTAIAGTLTRPRYMHGLRQS